MNYRHAYHAGNFADVLKHAVLGLCLERLGAKDKPYAVIDTHAGVGWYDLHGDEARRSPEWEHGLARVLRADQTDAVRAALAPYLSVVKAHNPELQRENGSISGFRWAPGSPAISADLSRPQDRLVFCELHPDDNAQLADRYEADPRVKTPDRDGYKELKALLPPRERRGLVLIDPPFEHVDEMYFLARAAKDAFARWPTGTFIFWRPLKEFWAAERFDVGLAEWLLGEQELAPEKLLRADLWVRELSEEGPLAGAGVVVINPPYGLDQHLLALLPWLAETLKRGAGAGWRLDGALAADSLTVDEF